MFKQQTTFNNIIRRLKRYWSNLGFVALQPIDTEVGAGTLNPQTFFNILKFDTWNCFYVENCRRPLDSCFGENSDRFQYYYQFQVINKPSFYNIKSIYLDSLSYLGLDLKISDIKFLEDNWEHPGLGANGLGWEVWFCGSEITQFTYMKQCGGIPVDIESTEITYGLERIVKILQKQKMSNNIVYSFDNKSQRKMLHRDLYLRNEQEISFYNMYLSKPKIYMDIFEKLYSEAELLLQYKITIPSYEKLLKCSHILNILDSAGSLSSVEKTYYIQRLRNLSKQCTKCYVFFYNNS